MKLRDRQGPLDLFGRSNPPTMVQLILPRELGGHEPRNEDNSVKIEKG